jgi:hypothetical protein
MNMSPRHRFSTILIATAILALSGCKTPLAESMKLDKLNEHMPWHDPDAPREGVPTKVVGNWVDAVHYQEGKKPQRGFGGKLLFYDNEGDAPILVDGELIVYAFNEQGRASTDNMPTRRYVFPTSELTKLMSVSELGAGYSVWLPWDEAGGPEAEVSLICRFSPKAGPVLVSEQTRQLLPGSKTSTAVADGNKPKMPEGVPYRPAVELATYIAPDGRQPSTTPVIANEAAVSPPRQMTSTTISIPQSMQGNLGSGTSPGVLPQRPAAVNLPTPQSAVLPATVDPSATRGSGHRLSSTLPRPTRMANMTPSALHASAGSPLGSGSNGDAALRQTTQMDQATTTMSDRTNSTPIQSPASVQAISQGYGNHPLSTPSASGLAPIGSSAGPAQVTYPHGK